MGYSGLQLWQEETAIQSRNTNTPLDLQQVNGEEELHLLQKVNRLYKAEWDRLHPDVRERWNRSAYNINKGKPAGMNKIILDEYEIGKTLKMVHKQLTKLVKRYNAAGMHAAIITCKIPAEGSYCTSATVETVKEDKENPLFNTLKVINQLPTFPGYLKTAEKLIATNKIIANQIKVP
jgi:hypothetical protein